MSTSVQAGELIAEKYRVERVIGQGGMGVVLAAVHVELGHRVAVKLLLPNALRNADALARFEREARAAVTLHSAHVSKVHDVGRLPDGAPYIVMELLEGTDLSRELHHKRQLPIHEAVTHIIQACDALAEAHALGIVHRDIKPANLFLARRPKRAPIVKVLDFGISKATSLTDAASPLTRTTDLIGSPLYMSPEQLKTPRDVDARSDIWSLGATLFELLSGSVPFDGGTMAELSANILMTPAPDVRTKTGGAHVPEALAAILARCLEKDPANRWATAEDLAAALAPFAAFGEPIEGASLPAPPPDGDVPATAVTPARASFTLPLLPAPARAKSGAASAPGSPPRRSIAPAVVVTLAAIAGAAALGFRALHAPSTPPEAGALAPGPPAPIASEPAVVSAPPSALAPPAATVAASAPSAPSASAAPSSIAVARPPGVPVRSAVPSPSTSLPPSPSAPPKPSASPLDMHLQ